jgi:hypothetical protein
MRSLVFQIRIIIINFLIVNNDVSLYICSFVNASRTASIINDNNDDMVPVTVHCTLNPSFLLLCDVPCRVHCYIILLQLHYSYRPTNDIHCFILHAPIAACCCCNINHITCCVAFCFIAALLCVYSGS